MRFSSYGFAIGLVCVLSGVVCSQDWTRFRGPNGSGIAKDPGTLPTNWSPTENLQWKVALPGPGSSSPIIVGDKVFVTCWSGYAVNKATPPGDEKDLMRHLICVDRNLGKILWDKEIAPYLPEDPFGRMFAEHGYASHTPVSDGEKVFAFFGKTGAIAFDLDGKELWRKQVGTGSGDKNWGSSSSPILFEDLLICSATAEDHAIVALNKNTGDQVWIQKADGFSSTWGTPVLVDSGDGNFELVIGVPNEFWSLNPRTGKLNWYCTACQDNSYCSSLVAGDAGVVFGFEGRGGGGFAVKAGGKDDVTKSNIVWKSQVAGRISSPLYADGNLYVISGGMVSCLDAESGKAHYQSRLAGGETSPQASPPPTPPKEDQSQRGTGGGQGEGARASGRRGGGGGGMGGQDYASPVAGDGKLFYVSRGGDFYVIQLGTEFKRLAVNRVTTDKEDFSATPAISNEQIIARSDKHLYCIGATKK